MVSAKDIHDSYVNGQLTQMYEQIQDIGGISIFLNESHGEGFALIDLLWICSKYTNYKVI